MLELARRQDLVVIQKVEFGVYLGESEKSNGAEKVLLPKKQIPQGTQLGDTMNVFLYRDSEDRIIATTATPLIMMGETAVLKVKEVNKYGAFLNWGLEKDLFLPFKQQTYKVQQGDECLVTLYIDKSNRLCATMKVYPYLSQESPYHKEDKVSGLVYEISDNFGAFVAIDKKYSALVPKKEQFGNIKPGEIIQARVTRVHEDGKLELSVREKAYLQMGEDEEKILKLIDSFSGALPFNDKANPEVIRRETGMSKNEFKRAVGGLLKAGKIKITDTSIRRI